MSLLHTIKEMLGISSDAYPVDMPTAETDFDADMEVKTTEPLLSEEYDEVVDEVSGTDTIPMGAQEVDQEEAIEELEKVSREGDLS